MYSAQSLSTSSFGQMVAIKMIDKSQMRAQHFTKRVGNEVEIHWQLRHASILELLNYFEDPTHVYLVMELCSSGSLFDHLKRVVRLPQAQVRNVMYQLVNGLVYLHSNGIIHRDLKLSNLLLDGNRNLVHPPLTQKIADFGLAAKLQDVEGEQKTMCGTPNYISPEIVSRQPYGLSSDVWALGCMMVTLLTGSPPFHASAVKNTLERVARVDYSLPSYVSVEATDLIRRLLRKVCGGVM